MKQEDIEALVAQSQREFIDRLVMINLIDPDDDQTKGIVAIFLRRYSEDLTNIVSLLIEEKSNADKPRTD